jgi:hypothetical protein
MLSRLFWLADNFLNLIAQDQIFDASRGNGKVTGEKEGQAKFWHSPALT